MNGFEIERLLTLIDQNIALTTASRDEEVIEFVKQHEDEVLGTLRREGYFDVPTSLGVVHLSLHDLEAAAA